MNKVFLIGTVTKVDIFPLKNGGNSSTMTVETVERFGNDTFKSWHTVKAFGKLEEYVEANVKENAYVCVEGRLTYHTWEDKNGSKRTDIYVSAEKMDVIFQSNQSAVEKGNEVW